MDWTLRRAAGRLAGIAEMIGKMMEMVGLTASRRGGMAGRRTWTGLRLRRVGQTGRQHPEPDAKTPQGLWERTPAEPH